MSLRDGAIEAMREETENLTLAQMALDALLDYLEAHADEWETTAMPETPILHEYAYDESHALDLIAVLRGDS